MNIYYLKISMSQDSGHILAVSSAKGLIVEVSVKLQYHLEAEREKRPLPSSIWLLSEFISLWLYNLNLQLL